MKRVVYTLLAVTALSFPVSQAAHAVDASVNLGVSTPVVNTSTQAHTQTTTQMKTDGTHYRRDTVTEDTQHYGENDIHARTQHNMHVRSAPQDISPAAGIRENIPPSARVMGRIQGGQSYND